MTTYAISARQRLVGSRLRQYREKAGYELADAARILGCHRSGISRIETGQRGIRVKDLRELLAEYGADPAEEEALAALARPLRGGVGWWSRYEQLLPSPYLELASAEATASAIAVYAPVQVPALLQAPGYARAVAAADPCLPEESEAAAVDAALDRQRVVLEQRDTPLSVVIGEAALRQKVDGPTVMRAQLSHLTGIAERCQHVSIRLLSFITGASSAGGTGEFAVLQYGPVPALGLSHVTGPTGGLFPESPETTSAYLRLFTHLQALALTPEHTRRRFWEITRTLGG